MDVYVDDLLIGSADLSTVNEIKEKLAIKFPVTAKGKLHHYLVIEVERDGDLGSMQICHSQYIQALFNEYGMASYKPISTPLDAKFLSVL